MKLSRTLKNSTYCNFCGHILSRLQCCNTFILHTYTTTGTEMYGGGICTGGVGCVEVFPDLSYGNKVDGSCGRVVSPCIW